ncbi:protein O-linked-mannose beta-1,4-N-acetylglucosaminyltransferase 2-like [Dendronephthya gigantea]|uniref:protein O-linked-mannose beta-1,4-N-acetylglucosaminyltransferase 2-like n=1 Tax=Dendronephthya gigantea TaxID=151771 RepID=UPI00106B1937|nr:protein O-linked-mannose beta-1,4-N-acetylglucosaminyltransferase 2-like [Dendronephthya gigantea]
MSWIFWNPILLSKLLQRAIDTLVCFQEVTVGISKFTTWYEYGFHMPQAPLPNHTADGTIIRQFTTYITNKLGVTHKTKDSDYLILFSRESNRLILNELELTFTIATTFNLRIVRLSLETNELGEIIKQIQGSAGIIGMHGSILVLSMFLSPGTFVIELFPYAINPQNYTPYKTLAEIMDIRYRSWQNKFKNNTIVYPNRSKTEGGIIHLDKETQTEIINMDDVPPHLCCNDPYWLFRIYQDTAVDIPSFIGVLRNALNEVKKTQKRKYIKKYPGKIRSILCKCLISKDGVSLFVSWEGSWNMQFYNNISYEVWIQDTSDQNYMAYLLSGVTEHTFHDNITYNTTYSIWIRGVINDNYGPFSNSCTCSP